MGSEFVVTSDKKQVYGSELVVIYFREKVVNRYSLRSDYLKKAGGGNIQVIGHVTARLHDDACTLKVVGVRG